MLTNIVFIAKTQEDFDRFLSISPQLAISEIQKEYPIIFCKCSPDLSRSVMDSLNVMFSGRATALDKVYNLMPCTIDEVYSVLVPIEGYFTLSQNLLTQGVMLEPDVGLMP